MTAEHASGAKAASAGASGHSTTASTGHVLSDGCRAQVVALRKNYPEPRAALLPALHLAQGEHGYLPRPVVDEVATLLDLLIEAS